VLGLQIGAFNLACQIILAACVGGGSALRWFLADYSASNKKSQKAIKIQGAENNLTML